MTRRWSSWRLALAYAWPALAAASCTTDASLTKELAGTSWKWSPRQQLPKEKVPFESLMPDLEAVQFGADGRFVIVQSLLPYDTLVAGTTVHVPDFWIECHGSWSVAEGKLLFDESEEERWAARHESKGWLPENPQLHHCGMISFKIVEHLRHRLQLQEASGDYDRTLERASTIPERPTLSKP